MTHRSLTALIALVLTACSATSPERLCAGPLVSINAPMKGLNHTAQKGALAHIPGTEAGEAR
jgi:hypothetical protein